MRTLLLLCICAQFAADAAAQTFLTNGEIHDYQPGDVFQSKGQSSDLFGQQQPPHTYTDTILSREEFGGDSIRYIKAHWEVAYQYFPLAPVVTSSIDTLIVRDLDQAAGQEIQLCYEEDTLVVYNPQCGLLRWSIYSGVPDSCNGEYNSSWYYEGCGGPYSTLFIDGLGSWLFELIYYYKGNLECGTFWDLPMGVQPPEEAGVVHIGPNPTTGLINAQGIGPRGALIVSALGQRVGQLVNGKDIDITRLPAATYWLVGEDVNGRSFRTAIVKR